MSKVCCLGTDCHELRRGRFLPCEVSCREQGHWCPCEDVQLDLMVRWRALSLPQKMAQLRFYGRNGVRPQADSGNRQGMKKRNIPEDSGPCESLICLSRLSLRNMEKLVLQI